MNEYEAKAEKEVREFAETFSRFANRLGRCNKGAVKALANDHPTLQQNVMRFFLEFCQEMAQKPYSDARNEASVELAKKIVKLEGQYLPFV